MRIEMAVGQIVDHATGRTHQHRPENEDPDHQPVRPAQRRQPQRPQGWPEQQQDADRFVEAHQSLVKVDPFAPCFAGNVHAPHFNGHHGARHPQSMIRNIFR
jgi:hypothetical protein